MDECSRQRGATGSLVVSSTLGHRHNHDVCTDHDVTASHRRSDAVSQHFYAELMKLKQEEFSPQSGQSNKYTLHTFK